MAQTPSNVIAGPARVFVGLYSGVVNPVSGTPPTLFAHTAGVPSGLQTGFTEVGYTTGPTTFEYKATKVEIAAEQSLLPVDIFTSDELSQVTFTCLERLYQTLQAAFDNIGSVSDAAKDLFYAGNGTSILTPSPFSIFVSHRHRDNVNKFSCANIYRAYSVDGIKLPFDKKKETTFLVTLKALADTTRSAGDQAFQLFHEK